MGVGKDTGSSIIQQASIGVMVCMTISVPAVIFSCNRMQTGVTLIPQPESSVSSPD